MRKSITLAAAALLTVFGLSACNKQEASAPVETATHAKPTSASDTAGWQAYLSDIVRQNLQGMTASRPYVYFVPAGDDDETLAQRQRQLDTVQMTVARTVLPGNLLVFAGPDSATTATFVSNAFQGAEKGSFDGVLVLFIGDQANTQQVKDALAISGATFRFAQL